jgi:hypothetical protein
LLWWIVHWRRDIDRLCVVVGVLISRLITSIPIAVMFTLPFPMAAIVVTIATPFLMAIIAAAPVTPAMAVVMISEC